MEGKGNLIAAIIVIVLVLAVILGTLLYLSRALGNKVSLSIPFLTKKTVSISPSPRVSSTSTPGASSTSSPTNNPSGSPVQRVGDKAVYNGKGFQIQYPANWGLLSCTNSQNFELDPYNSSNQKVNCTTATKPITALVDQGVSCRGDLVKYGPHQVYVSKVQYRDWFTNEYCFNEGGHNFDITNRVANSGVIGTGKDDFASQVEQMIATMSF